MIITTISNAVNKEALILNPTEALDSLLQQHSIDFATKAYNQEMRYRVVTTKDSSGNIHSKFIPIFEKSYSADSVVDNRIHVSLDRDIINIKQGYMDAIQVSYNAEDESEEQIDRINKTIHDFQTLNNLEDLNSEMFRHAATCGAGYRLMYIGAEGKTRVRNINPWQAFVITGGRGDEYDPDYGVYYYDVTDEDGSVVRLVEWYDRSFYTIYKQTGGSWSPLTTNAHGFKGVPLIPFNNNDEKKGDCEASYSLMDDYDKTVSSASNIIGKMDLALLILKGHGLEIDEETENNIVNKRMVAMTPEDSAEFLSPNINDEHVVNHIKRLRRDIYDTSNSVDFSDPDLRGNVPIIGWKVAYSRLEQSASKTERKFKSALRRQYQLLASVDANFRELEWDYLRLNFIFDRKMIDNMSEEIQNLAQLKGLVSLEDAYRLTPFIDDTQAYIERYEDDLANNTTALMNQIEEEEDNEESTEI